MKTERVVWYLAIAAAVVLVVIAYLLVMWSTPSPQAAGNAATTSQEIFEEATGHLGVGQDRVTYFKIFGSDRVMYGTGNGANYGYKMNGEWHLAGPADQQEVPDCMLLTDVPEAYRPPCYDTTVNQSRYVTDEGFSANYPPSEMSTYK